jgi:D-alanine transaminase
MIVYFNGEFIPKEAVKLSPDDRGFLFADGVYEVIRIYQGQLFALEPHLKRMDDGLRDLRICKPSVDFKKVAQRLIRENDLTESDGIVYIQITRGPAPRKHAFPKEEISPTIYAFVSPAQAPEAQWQTGVKVILTPDIRWTRCNIKSIALLPNTLANQQAKENNAFEAIFVRNGIVTEGSLSNFCGVFEGQLFTHPKSQYILPGITRDIVLDLCQDLNIPVKEYPMLEQDLKKADELMVVGTTTEVMPVVQVDDWQVGNGHPGPITRKLHQAFQTLKANQL